MKFLLKNLLCGCREQQSISLAKDDCDNPLKQHEQKFIEKVINMLENKPENFSAKWFDGKALNKSVQHKNQEILIGKNGDILQPIEPDMTKEQKSRIKQLCVNIFERDSLEILKKYDL